jgi:hypothetical protein
MCYRPPVRVRILRRMSGVINGVALSQFGAGLHYDLDSALARYLIEQRLAVEAPESHKGAFAHSDADSAESLERLTRGVFVMGNTQTPRHVAQHRRRKTDR